MDDGDQLIIGITVYLAVCVLMTLFGLSAETALRSADARLERMTNDKRARKISALQENAELLRFRAKLIRAFFGMAAIAVCICSISVIYDAYFDLYGGYYTDKAVRLTCGTIALIWLLLTAVYVTLCAELPRRAAKTGRLSGENGENFALRTVGFLSFMLGLFSPLTLLGQGLLKLASMPFGVKPEVVDETGEDLIQLIDAQSEDGGIEEEQAEMISNIFEFSDLELHEVMTHRTEIAAAELNSTIGEVVQLAVETGFSRIPIYRETIDEICGVIYVKDLLPLVVQADAGSIPVSMYLRKIKYVPESGSCEELFAYFTENNRHIAAVLDEYGGTAGLVTMEDLLECIVGNIRDEYDGDEEEEIEEITPHTFDILGSADPDEAMELLGSPLPEEHGYDTMGGFVTDLLGFIPEDGQTPTVRFENITFRVISARDNRIEKLRAVKDRSDTNDDKNNTAAD